MLIMAESDVYSSQLREVFDTFDTTGEGALGKESLQELCEGLGLEEYTDLLLEKVLVDNQKGKVEFDDFKEAFIGILQDADHTSNDTRNSSGFPYPVEVTPKYVLGSKKYGRRSKPENSYQSQLDDDDHELLNIRKSANDRPANKQGERVISPASETEDNEFHIKRRRKDAPRPRGAQDETFEAEGQMNLTMTDTDVDSRSEKLLEVWRTLGVGQDGYLTLAELRTVCNYIGMEMDDDGIWKLFMKLDNDHDGRVSFEELLSSFSQNSSRPLTPSPRPSKSLHRTQRPVGTPVLRSLSAQRKLRLAATPGERNVVPVGLSSGEVTGLFSSLDVYHSGFAQPEDITDLWEKHNIMNGADVLTALGFDHDTKVNLSELSFALEQTLANEDLDAVSRVALVTYQQELRHLRSSVDALTGERNKLRLDLQEANARSALLAKEVDERHAHMEKSNEVKLLTIEKKYQDQIRSLQGALESERETHSAHSAKLRQDLESEMEELKHQESKLKDNLSLAQAEVDRLQTECNKSGECLEEAYKQNSRLHVEMDSLADLRRKVSEYEQMHDAGEEKQHYLNKIHWLEQANKDMKDKVDELTAELENLKQQLASCKRKLRGSSSSSQTKIPIREGSHLSDYTKLRRKSSLASLTSPDAAEIEEVDSIKSKARAPKLTSRKGRNSLEDDSSSEHSLSNSQKLELLEKDQQQIEHAYRLEVANLEDKHQTEKENILQNFEKEKAKLREEFKRSQQERLAEQQMELQNVFTQEKQDLLQKYESKKNLLVQQHDQEKEELLQRLKEEYAKDVDLRLGKVSEDFAKERARLEQSRDMDRGNVRDLEKMCTDLEMRLKSERIDAEQRREKDLHKYEEELEHLKKAQEREIEKIKQRLEAGHRQKLQEEISESQYKHDRERTTLLNSTVQDQSVIQALEQKVADLDLQLKLQREEIEAECERRCEELEKKHQLEMQDLETRYKLEIMDIESLLEQGVSGLRGKLKDDFEVLVEQGKEESIAAERTALYEDLSRRRSEMEAERGEILQQLEQKQVDFENERRRVFDELGEKRLALDAENDALERKKAGFEEESHQILDELERQETIFEQARDLMRKEKEEFEEIKQQIEASLEEQRKDLEEQLQNVKLREEEVETERTKLVDDVQQKELQLESEMTLLEERKLEFEQKKSEYEENLTQHQEDLNSDLQKQLTSLEAEEQLLQDRKAEFVSEKEKQWERLHFKEGELKAEQTNLQTRRTEFETERTQILNQLQEEKNRLKDEQEKILLQQRDIEKDFSASLSDLNKERERLKEEQDKLTQKQSEFEKEQASVLEDLKVQREDVKVSKDELDKRKNDIEKEHSKVLQDLHMQKDEVKIEKDKLVKKQRDLEMEHVTVLNHLQEKQGEMTKEKTTLEEIKALHQARELELRDRFEEQKEKLCLSYEEEKTLLMEKYQDEILDLQQQLNEMRQLLEERRVHLEIVEEEEQRQRELEVIQAVREDMQSCHVRQITELQEVFQSEQTALKEQSRMLEEQITDLQGELLAEQDKNRQTADQKQKTISRLQSQLKQVEDMRDSLQEQLSESEQETTSTRERLERRIDELLSEKEAAVTAVKAEFVHAVQKAQNSQKEKAQEDMRVVSSKMVALEDELAGLKEERDVLQEYKLKYDQCFEDKISCEAEIRDLQRSVSRLESDVKKLQNVKKLYEQSVMERERLEQQLRESLQAAGEITNKHETSLDESSHSVLLKERDALQNQVMELRDQLRNTQVASTEVEKLKVDLGNMAWEKAELQDKLKTFKDQIQDTRTSQRREDKEEANADHKEKNLLEKKLQKVSDKLLKASTDLSVAQSRHLQEISRWKDCTKNMVDLEQFTNLQLGLIEQQRHMNELQASLQEKLELIDDLKVGHKKLVKQLEGDKKELHSKLAHSHNMFKEQAQKLMKTYESLSERNMLVKSLFEEKCQLAKKVKITEDRQRHAEKRCLHVERKCAGLQRVINQASQTIENNLT